MMNFSSFGRRLLKEVAWAGFGKIAAALGMLVGIRLLTETVPKEVYGTVSLLIGLITLGNNLFAAPLLQAAQRFYPEVVLSCGVLYLRYLIVNILKWSVGALACLTLLGGVIYIRFNTISYVVFPVLAALLGVQVMRNLETSLMTAARRQKEIAIWNTVEAWAKPVIAVLLVTLLGATPQSVLLGYFIAVGGILLCFYLLPVQVEGSNNSKVPFETDTELTANIRRYAMPLVPLALVAWVSSLSDRYIISGMLGVGQVGLYTAAYGLISMPFLMAGGIIGQTLRPPYYQAVSAGNITMEKKLLRTQLAITVLVCGAGVVAVFFLRNIIAALLLAKEYRSAVSLMPWIAAGIGLYTIAQVYAGVLHAYKLTKFILYSQSITAIVCVISVILFTCWFGLPGAAWACPVYFGVMVITNMFMAKNARKVTDLSNIS